MRVGRSPRLTLHSNSTDRADLVTQPAKAALKSGAKKVAQGALVRAAPPLAVLVAGGIAFNAIGHTAAVQKTGHIGNPGVLGMGGTL